MGLAEWLGICQNKGYHRVQSEPPRAPIVKVGPGDGIQVLLNRETAK